MKDIYLVNYSVKGIKTIDQLVSLSFYKKTITKSPDTKDFNVKGVYGMNGSGKSGIITGMSILKQLLLNSSYLNNQINQASLDSMINKKMQELFVEVEYLVDFGKYILLYRYNITLSKQKSGRYTISSEELSVKNALTKSDKMQTILKIENGEIVSIQKNNHVEFSSLLKSKTQNLLDNSTMCSLYIEKIFSLMKDSNQLKTNSINISLLGLFIFARKLHIYLDDSDNHENYHINQSLNQYSNLKDKHSEMNILLKYFVETQNENLRVLTVSDNLISKDRYEDFKKRISKLSDFIRIFKPDLQDIEIDKKENHDIFVCSLIMVYDSYKVHGEFESTGIKKLVKLYAYLNEMVNGNIVFIDEFDSNLHDVYLCALLEYLMEYGQGQLCFTTHNVGPMDVLRQHKKSIDFLSTDHQIYSWTTSGNYSPSKLYRNGMIEGSPFNVDSIDFIGVFSQEEDETWDSN